MNSVVVKLWGVLIGLVLVIVMIIGTFFFILFENYYYESVTEKMLREGQSIAETFEAGKMAKFVAKVEEMDGLLEMRMLVASESHQLAGCLPLAQVSEELMITMEERGRLVKGETVIRKGDHPRFDDPIMAVVLPLLSGNRMEGALFLYTPLTGIAEFLAQIKKLILYGGLFTLLVAASLSYWLSRTISRPLVQMEQVAREMASGKLERRITWQGKDEIGKLAASLNHLGENTEALVSQLESEKEKLASLLDQERQLEKLRQELVANVSHELRTPLSFLQGYGEILLDGVNSQKERDEYLEIMLQQALRLRQLVDDLLELSKLDAGGSGATKNEVDFGQVAELIAKQFILAFQEKEMELLVEVDAENTMVWGNKLQLERVLVNLLENALNHGGRGIVHLLVTAEENELVVTVRDQGAGIPAVELPFIWERFYKVDKSRSAGTGTGLGLAIVKGIVREHQGTIAVTSEEDRGTCFTLRLPLLIDKGKCQENLIV